MEHEPSIIKSASCPSLSHQSQLEYQIGSTPDGTIHLRLTGNSGNGNFNGYWVPLPEILSLLNDQDGPFTWQVMVPLFEGRSVNSSCFLMAALKNEGLIQQSKEQPRRYEMADPKEFTAKVQALMSPKPKPKKRAKKPPPDPPVTDSVIDPPADLEESTEAKA